MDGMIRIATASPLLMPIIESPSSFGGSPAAIARSFANRDSNWARDMSPMPRLRNIVRRMG
jgi:hypothetical protein